MGFYWGGGPAGHHYIYNKKIYFLTIYVFMGFYSSQNPSSSSSSPKNAGINNNGTINASGVSRKSIFLWFCFYTGFTAKTNSIFFLLRAKHILQTHKYIFITKKYILQSMVYGFLFFKRWIDNKIVVVRIKIPLDNITTLNICKEVFIIFNRPFFIFPNSIIFFCR